jgi:hypothetical protein
MTGMYVNITVKYNATPKDAVLQSHGHALELKNVTFTSTFITFIPQSTTFLRFSL